MSFFGGHYFGPHYFGPYFFSTSGGEVVADDEDESAFGIIDERPPRPIVAVEIDSYTGAETHTLRYFSGLGPLIATIDSVRAQYMPGLLVPLKFGTTISAEQYGEPVRGAASGGDVVFDMNADEWSYLSYHYVGREVRAYVGDANEGYAGLIRVYTGRGTDLRHSLGGVVRAQVSTTDAGVDLDNPLVDDQYDDTQLEPLRGRPKPELRGSCKFVLPALFDDANQTYHVSRLPLVSVQRVTVGGIDWQVTTAPSPAAGQYTVDLVNGTVQLGSTTLGSEVRVDATAATITTADLVTAIVTEAGGTVNTASMTQLDIDAPYEIGWFTGTDPINRLDALDQIMNGVGGYWYFNADGEFVAGVLKAPDDDAELTLTSITIQSMTLAGLLPPAWRIRVEHSRNWNPLTNALEGVTDAEREAYSQGGIIAAPFERESIKTAEPRAIDVPLIRSLVQNEADAIDIRDRLIAAWSVERRVYDVSANVTVPSMYGTVEVTFQMVAGNFRVHSAIRSLGGDPALLRLWGESGIVGVVVSAITGDDDTVTVDDDEPPVDEDGDPPDTLTTEGGTIPLTTAGGIPLTTSG